MPRLGALHAPVHSRIATAMGGHATICMGAWLWRNLDQSAASYSLLIQAAKRPNALYDST